MRLPARATSPTRTVHAPSGATCSDDELVTRIAAGDERAFEQLFITHYASLRDFVISYLRSPERAEDVVQGVLLRVWQQRRNWKPTQGVRAYLFGACRNAAVDALRHARTEERAEHLIVAAGESPGLGRPAPMPDENVAAHDLTTALHAAVEAMPKRRREVIVLRWQHQLGPTEIARVLGISVKGVEAHFARAFAELRQRLRAYR